MDIKRLALILAIIFGLSISAGADSSLSKEEEKDLEDFARNYIYLVNESYKDLEPKEELEKLYHKSNYLDPLALRAQIDIYRLDLVDLRQTDYKSKISFKDISKEDGIYKVKLAEEKTANYKYEREGPEESYIEYDLEICNTPQGLKLLNCDCANWIKDSLIKKLAKEEEKKPGLGPGRKMLIAREEVDEMLKGEEDFIFKTFGKKPPLGRLGADKSNEKLKEPSEKEVEQFGRDYIICLNESFKKLVPESGLKGFYHPDNYLDQLFNEYSIDIYRLNLVDASLAKYESEVKLKDIKIDKDWAQLVLEEHRLVYYNYSPESPGEMIAEHELDIRNTPEGLKILDAGRQEPNKDLFLDLVEMYEEKHGQLLNLEKKNLARVYTVNSVEEEIEFYLDNFGEVSKLKPLMGYKDRFYKDSFSLNKKYQDEFEEFFSRNRK